MGQLSLTDNERKVLLTVMSYPEHSDTDLSRAVDMNIYTFNKVKNSLISRGLIRKTAVPNYSLTGFELMVFTYGTDMDSFLDPFNRRDLISGFESKIPARFIFKIMEMHQGLGIHAVEDFTGLKRGLKLKRDLINELGIEIGSMTHVKFSFRDSTIKRFFDMLPMLREEFGSGFDIPKMDPKNPAQESASISWEEFFSDVGERSFDDMDGLNRDVLIRTVSEPDESDQKTATELGVSRYKIRKAKEELFTEGFLKTSYVPDIKGFGFEVVLFTHMIFKNDDPIHRYFSSMEEGFIPAMFHLVYDGLEGCGMGLFHKLSDASWAYHNLQDRMKNMNAIEKNPHLQLFSVSNSLTEYPFDFAQPLINRGSWELDREYLEMVKTRP